jgi:hypothetical protein
MRLRTAEARDKLQLGVKQVEVFLYWVDRRMFCLP